MRILIAGFITVRPAVIPVGSMDDDLSVGNDTPRSASDLRNDLRRTGEFKVFKL